MASKDSAARERLAKALQENLKRRKAAVRARSKPGEDASATPPPEPDPKTAAKPD
jgi:hypothetical protein